MTRLWPLALVLLLPMLPGVPLQWVTLADYAGISAVLVLGLVVLTGFGAMTSFGQATFMGFGAYATALLTVRLGVSPWLALPCSLLAAGVGAGVIGVVALRLSGHYLALGTLAWAVSLFYVFGNLDLLGRNDGIIGLPPLSVAGVRLLDGRLYYPVVALAVLGAVLVTRNLLGGRVGRAIRALRAGRAATSFGVSLTHARTVAFVHAGVLAGLSGWLYAHLQRAVNPSPFGLEPSIDALLMAVLGGVGHLWGALLGAALVTVLNDQLQDLLPRLFGLSASDQTVAFGALLVLMLQVAPEGLWPHVARLGTRLGTRRDRRRGDRPDGVTAFGGALAASGPALGDAAAADATLVDAAPVNAPRPVATSEDATDGGPTDGRTPARVAPPDDGPPPGAVPPLPARTPAARGTPLLRARGLRKQFGGLVAVADLSLELAAGEIVGLIGPNGAGKSTTFDLLTGVTRPTAGEVSFEGHPLRGGALGAARAGVARTFQHVRLVPGMSVLENAALGAHRRGRAGALRACLRLDRAEERQLLAEARRQVARVGLAGSEAVAADALPLGQQRLAEIARALCLDPVLLLLDEPAAGLRHAEKQALAALLRRLRAEGVGVLLVEHDMGFVMGLADRLVVMEFGTVLAQGTPEAVRADPAVIEAYLGAAA